MKHEITLSDLSEAPATATIRFAWENQHYEMDLTDDEYATITDRPIRELLAAAQKADPPRKPKKKMVPTATQADREEVKEWWRNQGHDVKTAGRVPNAAWRAWNAAHPDRTFDLPSQ